LIKVIRVITFIRGLLDIIIYIQHSIYIKRKREKEKKRKREKEKKRKREKARERDRIIRELLERDLYMRSR